MAAACAGFLLLGPSLAAELESGGATVEATSRSAPDLTRLEFEDLLHVKITSVSRKPEDQFGAASAIYVITGEDIRRSGVRSIPEALRMAPGLDVARMNAHQWAISSRGFNTIYANNLLVLVDGRTVYNPSFGGVFWDVVNPPLEDVDRIEVIRGPGATMWGVNAVNGVINIVTKSAADTQGGTVSGGGGDYDRGFGTVQYGAKIGENAFVRAYAKYFDVADFPTVNGANAHDGWNMFNTGLRLDWEPRAGTDLVTVQADFYIGSEDEVNVLPSLRSPPEVHVPNTQDLMGGNLLTRWTHRFDGGSESVVQMFYDRNARDRFWLGEDIQTFDVEGTYRFKVGQRQEFLCGLGYRLIADDFDNSTYIKLMPESQIANFGNAFIQDDVALIPNRLRMTVGTKVEYNYYTEFEFQPTIRFAWTPDTRNTLWASVSRAVRTPSRAESGGDYSVAVVPGPLPALIVGTQRGAFDSETMLAFELGYRVEPVRNLSFDVATFYSIYDGLGSADRGTPYFAAGPPPHIIVPASTLNGMDGTTYGVELAARWQATPWWRWDAAYTYLGIALHDNIGEGPYAETAENESPKNQFSLRSSVNLGRNVDLDAALRYVDSLSALDVPSYVTADVRLAWRPCKNVELAIVGQNLFQSRHLEFNPPPNIPFFEHNVAVPRAFYAKMTVRF